MRPNIDLNWQAHGLVKEFAEEHDLTLDSAYEELIMLGAAYHARSGDVRSRDPVIADLNRRVATIEAMLVSFSSSARSEVVETERGEA